MQAAELRSDAAVEHIVRVAGITGFVARYSGVLEVGCRQVGGVIYVQASAIRLHDVAGKAEAGLLGSLHVFGGPKDSSHDGKNKQCQEGKNFACAAYSNPGRCNGHGVFPCRMPVLLTVFTEIANILDQIFNLIVGKFLVIRRHFVFALLGDLEELSVALLADFRCAKVLHSKFLAHGSSAGAIRTMAGSALAFVKRLRVLSEGKRGRKE